MGTPITDPHVLAACAFINEHYAELGPRAPKPGSAEEQHAILVLSAYIRASAGDRGSRSIGRIAAWEVTAADRRASDLSR